MKEKRCFLALLDLLGFSELVLTRQAEEVSALLRRFQSLTRSVVSKANKQRQSHGLDRGRRSRLRLFSDLILIHTEGDSHDDCMDIVEICSKLFRLACENGLLPRGAIAWGDMLITPGLVVGRPLVEAHRLESEQLWAGISLCESMAEWDREEGGTADGRATILGVMKSQAWLVPWRVPIKTSADGERLAINWLTFDKAPYWHSRFADPSEEVGDSNARAKLERTNAFYRHISQLDREA